MAIWNILRPFDNIYGLLAWCVVIWYIFSGFWYHVPRQIWQPWSQVCLRSRSLITKCWKNGLLATIGKADKEIDKNPVKTGSPVDDKNDDNKSHF
jgi:hypothetical protein